MGDRNWGGARAGAGAPKGNQNAREGSMIRGTFRRVLAENEKKGRDSLLIIARKLVEQGEEGHVPSAKEVFDRVEGKANQPLSDPDGNPLSLDLNVRFHD